MDFSKKQFKDLSLYKIKQEKKMEVLFSASLQFHKEGDLDDKFLDLYIQYRNLDYSRKYIQNIAKEIEQKLNKTEEIILENKSLLDECFFTIKLFLEYKFKELINIYENHQLIMNEINNAEGE